MGERALFTSVVLLAGCSSDYTIGYLQENAPPPTLRKSVSISTSDVYATDGRSLYSLGKASMTFGDGLRLAGCDIGIVEITQNDRGEMWAAGFEEGNAALYRVDPRTGECTVLSKFATDAPWAIGFLPQSTGSQRLLGELSSGLSLLDATRGSSIQLVPTPLSRRAACDIVMGTEGFAYVASVLDWTDRTSPNLLERVDPITGSVNRTFAIDAGSIIDGLAVWSDAMYGFTRDGHVERLTITDHVTRTPVTVSRAPKGFTGASSGWTDIVPR